jgi:transcription elongation GreA/GreB family factor
MSKKTLVDSLLARARADLAAAESAAQAASTGAQSESMKSDGKYDTRGIEAGYLAGAQLKRVEELKLEIQMLEELPVKNYHADDVVGVGALVDLEINGTVRSYFIATTAGGTILKLDDKAVLVISVFSPIGDAVLGLSVGDEFELETASGARHHKIVKIA